VLKTNQFLNALERAREANKPAIIDLRTDPKAITPQTLE
jgi:thiamine pyrophosphate-dependent acetolactate synthase large subunit-like protein